MACKFIKYFKEPTKKYVCLTTSFFYKDLYIKMSPTLEPRDVTQDKVYMIYTNLKETVRLLDVYTMNVYLRIYYDKTVFKVAKYKELINELKEHPKVQLVEYVCDNFKSNRNNKNTDYHIDLFGTFIRFHPIFDDSSKKMEYYVSIDADDHYKPAFFEILKEFGKSGKLISCVSKTTHTNFHGDDYDDLTYFNYIYLIANCIIVKKHKIFKPIYWEKYFDNMFDQYDLMYKFNYIDFKRFAMNAILGKTQIKANSYYSFNYGADEIWINHVLRKVLIDNNYEDKLDAYFVKDHNIHSIASRLIDCLTYNSIKNAPQFKLFMKECKIFNETNFKKYIQKLKGTYQHIKFFKELTSNKFFNRLYIQNNIKYIIYNYEDLLTKQGKYNYTELINDKVASVQ